MTYEEPQKYVYLEYLDEIPENTDVPEPPLLRCSERERKQTEFYGQWSNVTDIKEPTSVSETQTNEKWLDAMEKEIDPLTMYEN